MDPYDMPEELSFLQAQDMGKIGFIQDLIHGIRKVLRTNHTKTDNIKEPDSVTEAKPSIESLMKRAHMFLEDGNFKRADEYFERVLDADPECVAAYMGKYLAENSLREESDIVERFINRLSADIAELLQRAPDSIFKNAPLSSHEIAKADIDKLKNNGFLSDEEINIAFSFDSRYVSHAAAFEKLKPKIAYPDVNPNYQKALRFASPEEKKRYLKILESVRDKIGRFKALMDDYDVTAEREAKYLFELNTTAAIYNLLDREKEIKRSFDSSRQNAAQIPKTSKNEPREQCRTKERKSILDRLFGL
jgi:tetratricopeptide (TPR) repeat protein